jgi:hypothetical protein
MLPEAFDHGGWLTGLMTVIGFLAAIFMGTLDEEKREDAYGKDHVSTKTVIESYSTVTDLAKFRG